MALKLRLDPPPSAPSLRALPQFEHVINLNTAAPFDIYCGRRHPRFSRRADTWGNWYKVGVDGSRLECIAKYVHRFFSMPALISLARKELPGAILGCWCHPEDCHADFLYAFTNQHCICPWLDLVESLMSAPLDRGLCDFNHGSREPGEEG